MLCDGNFPFFTLLPQALFSCLSPHKPQMLRLFSQARPLLWSVILFLTNPFVVVPSPALSLHALMLSAQGKKECPCQESGTLCLSRVGSLLGVLIAYWHFSESVFVPLKMLFYIITVLYFDAYRLLGKNYSIVCTVIFGVFSTLEYKHFFYVVA